MAASTPALRPGCSTPSGGELHLVVGRRFGAMGTAGHVIVVGPDAAALAAAAVERIEALEAAWSRFRPTSDVSRINRGAPNPVMVGLDTITLVERALAGWRLTGGRFDPLLLRPLEALGYNRPFGSWAHSRTADRPPPVPTTDNPDGVVVDRRACTIGVPAGVGFDPGGIGKGLAADLVTAELVADGAVGAMINLGGDLRVRGTGPRGSAWPVSIVDPDGGGPLVTIDLVDGAVATSSPVRRRWAGPDGPAHHLLDSRTGLPRPNGPRLTSVVAGDAWWAEVAATALCATAAATATPGPAGEPGIVGGLDGIAVRSVTDDGRVVTCPRFARYCRAPHPGRVATGGRTDG